MKRVSIIVGIVLGLVITTGVNAQNAKKQNLPCLTQVSGLTNQQKEQIVALEKSHQEQMADFRTERRSVTNPKEKAGVYDKMKAAKSTHQKDVLALMDVDQKAEYLAIQDGGKKQFKGKRNRKGQGNAGNGQGTKQGQGKFKGGKQGNCQGNCQGRNRTSFNN